MGNAVLLNASFLSAEALAPFAGGASALSRCLALAAGLPAVESIRIAGMAPGLLDGSHPALAGLGLRPSLGREGALDAPSLISELEAAQGRGAEHIFLLPADAPLVDPDLCERLFALHQGQVAEYSFADGHPYGLCPEILRSSILPILAMLAKGMEGPGGRDLLFSIIQKDINGFDVETEISPVDLRQYRLSLTCDTLRNRLIAESLLAAGASDAQSIARILPGRRDLLRSLPAYLAVQVAAACPQSCSLCPYPRIRPDLLSARETMPLGRFTELMDQMEALSRDAVVCPSLWGECALHPEIASLVGAVLARPRFRCLIETSGIGWATGSLEAIAASPGARERIDWVLSLDAMTEAGYRSLRGEGRAEALACADRLLSLFPGRLHVQAVRVAENEAELEEFHKHWRGRGAHVIIQKHDDFAAFMPHRALVDLSPLKRHECWHLKRDISVLLDGTVPLCREDLNRTRILGNAFEGGLAAAWKAMEGEYRRQLDGVLEGPCAACDEYYTYNF